MTYMPLELRLPHTAAPCDRERPDALDVEAARQLILADIVPLNEAEHVPVGEAIGRIAADHVTSPVALPRFDNSAMDGYALHAADLTAIGWLSVGGQVQAGQADVPALLPGTVVRVTTGAAIPAGTAAVVPDEDVDLRPSRSVRVRRLARAGASIRRRGEDTEQGDILIKAGTRIDARHVAIVSAAGVRLIGVRRRPKVALLSVGNELVGPGDAAGPNRIVDVNRILLRDLLAASGAEVVDLGIAEDSVRAVAQRLSMTTGIDVLITTGGLAGSECDITARGFEEIGGEVSSLRLNLKPGRTIAFGRQGQLRSLHLPGNPLAALVSAYLFAVPMLNLLMANQSPSRTDIVPAGETLRHRQGRTEFVLVKVIERSADGRRVVVRAGKGSSANLQPLCEADGFVEVPAAMGDVLQGQTVRFHAFGSEFG